jgi:hypothetical protein
MILGCVRTVACGPGRRRLPDLEVLTRTSVSSILARHTAARATAQPARFGHGRCRAVGDATHRGRHSRGVEGSQNAGDSNCTPRPECPTARTRLGRLLSSQHGPTLVQPTVIWGTDLGESDHGEVSRSGGEVTVARLTNRGSEQGLWYVGI